MKELYLHGQFMALVLPCLPGIEKIMNRRRSISELDLQNLRHLIGGFDTTHCKMDEYARQATDAQVKQFFQKSAQSAADCKNQLMQYLQ